MPNPIAVRLNAVKGCASVLVLVYCQYKTPNASRPKGLPLLVVITSCFNEAAD
jgi:hypothetical protein